MCCQAGIVAHVVLPTVPVCSRLLFKDGLTSVAVLIIVAPARLYAAVALASVPLIAAVLAAGELALERKPERILFGAFRIVVLLYAGAVLLVHDAPRRAGLALLPFGLWAAIRPLRKGMTISLLGIGAFLARRISRRGVERVQWAAVMTLTVPSSRLSKICCGSTMSGSPQSFPRGSAYPGINHT